MGKKLKSIFVFLLSTVMILTSPIIISVNSFTSYAAGVTELDQLQKQNPVGTILTSDSFPGFKILYDGKEKYEVKNGINKVSLKITVIDEILAKRSVPFLKFFFGAFNIEIKTGKTLVLNASFKGVSNETYKEYNSLAHNSNDKESENAFESATQILISLFGVLADEKEYHAFDEATNESSSNINEIPKKENVTPKNASEVPKNVNDTVKEESKENGEEDSDDDSEEDFDNDSEEDSDDSTTEETDEDDSYARTVMIFLNGTDLESCNHRGSKNMLDLLRANLPDNTKVFITTGGTLTWHMADADYYKEYAKDLLYPNIQNLSDAQKKEVDRYANELYEDYATEISQDIQIYEVIKANGNDNVNSLSLLDTFTDMYFLETTYLTYFIDYVTAISNSEFYDLIFWDHGSGIEGYGVDEIYKQDLNDHITEKREDIGFSLAQLMTSIENTDLIKNGNKFDFIGFDACQMATIEVAGALHNYADYLILSQENIPGEGWDYNAFVNSIGDNPDINTIDLGCDIVDSFMDQYKDYEGNTTLSLIDCSKLDGVNESLSSFAYALIDEIKDINGYENVIATIGKEGDYGIKKGFKNECLLDIVKLCSNLIESGDITDNLKNKCTDLINSIEGKAVIYTKGKDTDAGNCGLSINFPTQPFSKAYGGVDKEGKERNYYQSRAEAVDSVYADINANEVYMKAYAQLALTTIAAYAVGDLWTNSNSYTTDDIINILEDKDSVYDAEGLIERAGVDFGQDQDLRGKIDYFLENRVRKDEIAVEIDDEQQTATITITDVDPVVIDETVNVQVALTIDGTDHFIGQTPLFSEDATKDEEGKTVDLTVAPFDQKWYTINDQITSFYLTDVVDENGVITYYGYIPLSVWNDAKDVQTPEGYDSRDAYFKEAASDSKVKTVFINVSSTNENEYSFDSYQNADNGSIGPYSNISEIEGHYAELLSGAESIVNNAGDDQIHSIGTIFFDNEATLKLQTVADLSPIYTVSDSYGNEYEICKDNYGNDILDKFVQEVDLYETSYENSN
ncbi:hypothetical protein SAMN04487928_111111 [Butyrivibrio proteoclasticus]|uniref:Peptidase C11 family n=1 Tax=Butyrivibrio proteoclasticus TaxID=43305 RepID=A0A1I5U869_9FIRM|nr:clostripain-related cysteine peptidase [Butyrivibrio proteoclasticus]SFP91127.1 hypothetical protein SAMN04487928_111111 [Butyrivibrio proteoclasticus]